MPENAGSFSAQELLEHADFVRTLARGLLFDHHQADEVVQQTWLAALENLPKRRESPRPWLSAVAKHFAFQKNRTETRRSAVEVQAARSELVPSAEEILERESARQELIQSVLKLETPYRDVLLLRYFEDLSPRQIAAQLRLSKETVRTRLKRGLAKLRLALDKTHGSRRNWCLLLIPIAVRAPQPPVSIGPVGPSIAAAALLITVGLMLQRSTNADKQVARLESGSGQIRAFEHGPASLDEDFQGRSLIRGQVMDEENKPVRGAWVYFEENEEMTPWLEGSIDEDPFRELDFPRTVSRKSGAFALDSFRGISHLENPAGKTLRIAAVADGYFPVLSKPFQLSANETDNSKVHVVLKKKIPILGRVIDAETGEPIAGARVQNFYKNGDQWMQTLHTRGETRTDKRGYFIDPLGQTGTVRIEVSRDEYINDGSNEIVFRIHKGEDPPNLLFRLRKFVEE